MCHVSVLIEGCISANIVCCVHSELVADRDDSGTVYRLLVWDVPVLAGVTQRTAPFVQRLKALQREVFSARKHPSATHDYSSESVHPRLKDFFPLHKTEHLTGAFANALPHDCDGVVFAAEEARGAPPPLLVWTPPQARFYVSPDGRLLCLSDRERGLVAAAGATGAEWQAEGVPTEARGLVVQCVWDGSAWRYQRTHAAGTAAPTRLAIAQWVCGSEYLTREALLAAVQQVISGGAASVPTVTAATAMTGEPSAATAAGAAAVPQQQSVHSQ